MKKIILSIVSIALITLQAVAQVPNGGFENWTTTGFPDPVGWPSANVLNVLGNPQSVYQCTAAADVHGGNYAVKIKTITLTTNPFPGQIDNTLGVCLTGAASVSGLTYGYPSTQKPLQMELYGKYLPNGNDTAIAGVWLQRKNGIKRDTIAMGFVAITGTVSAYTHYTVPLIYNPLYASQTPDTAVIVLSSSGRIEANRKVGSLFWVDDVSFVGTYNGVDNMINTPVLNVFPNPANNELNFTNIPTDATSLNIYDVTGKNKITMLINDVKLSIETQAWPVGIYMYEFVDANKTILNRGKVSVKH